MHSAVFAETSISRTEVPMTGTRGRTINNNVDINTRARACRNKLLLARRSFDTYAYYRTTWVYDVYVQLQLIPLSNVESTQRGYGTRIICTAVTISTVSKTSRVELARGTLRQYVARRIKRLLCGRGGVVGRDNRRFSPTRRRNRLQRSKVFLACYYRISYR